MNRFSYRRAPLIAVPLLPFALSLLFMVASPSGHAAAANRYWVNPAGGTFNQSNWSTTFNGPSGASVPNVGEDALFNINGTYAVTFSANASSDRVFVASSTVTFMSNTSAVRVYQVNSGVAEFEVDNNGTLYIGSPTQNRPVWLYVGGDLIIGTGGNGTAVVSGDNSRLDVFGNGPHQLGFSLGTATLTYQNGANGTIDGALHVGVSPFDNGIEGYLNVLSDADLTVGNLLVGTDDSGTFGEIVVQGSGSTLAQAGSSTLTLGAPSGGNSLISVTDGAVYSTGTGDVTLNATGMIALDRGTFNVNGTVTNNGGVFNFIAGALNIAGNVAVGDDAGLLANSLTLSTNRHLSVTGTTTIEPFRTVILDGGSLTTGSLAMDGTLDFRRGSLGISGTGGLVIGNSGPFGPKVGIGDDQRLTVTTMLNVATEGLLVVSDAGHVQAATVSSLGEIELAGSQATLVGDVSNAGLLHGHGKVIGTLTNQGSGELRANANQRLAFTSTVPNTNAGLVNLQGGTAEFSTALTNNAGGRIIGRGTLITGGALSNHGEIALSSGITDVFQDVRNNPGGRITISGNADVTFWDDVTNNGTLFRVSAGSSATFFGTLSGTGVSGPGDIFIEGDITPGSSPGTMAFGGDVSFGPLAALAIEIGGTTPGTDFDVVTVANRLSLDGTLDVTRIDDFALMLPGETFTIVTAGSLDGTFSEIVGQPSAKLPGLFWNVTYTPTAAILSTSAIPGDLDLDYDVDRTDAALFTRHFGTTQNATWTSGDFNSDNATTLADLVLLQANFGRNSRQFAPTFAVPEPATGLVAALGFIGMALPRIRRRSVRSRDSGPA